MNFSKENTFPHLPETAGGGPPQTDPNPSAMEIVTSMVGTSTLVQGIPGGQETAIHGDSGEYYYDVKGKQV